MTMQFFLTEIVARVVAIYFLIDGVRALRQGLVERKFYFMEFSLMDLIVTTPPWIADSRKFKPAYEAAEAEFARVHEVYASLRPKRPSELLLRPTDDLNVG